MSPSKKIIYIAGGRSIIRNAPGRKISSILNCWKRMGHQVQAVFGSDLPFGADPSDDQDFGHAKHSQKLYRRIKILNPFVQSVSEYRDIRHHNAMVTHLDSLVDSFRPDLIWERSSRLHFAGLVVARKIGVPYVLEWKDNLIPYQLSLYHSHACRIARYKNEQADYIVTESEVLRDYLAGQGINKNKISVAFNAVDANQFYRDNALGISVRNNLGIPADTILVGYIGSYAWYHDTEQLVKAMSLLRSRGIEKIKCLMVGNGQHYDKTRRLAEKTGLLNTCILMNPPVTSAEVPAVLSAIDIAVLPGSTDIICPIKIQEYMAAQLPTVAPDYQCNREVIRHGQTGLLFKPKSENALADEIALLANDRQMRERMGRLARDEAIQRFSWEATWGNALKEVLKNTNDSYIIKLTISV